MTIAATALNSIVDIAMRMRFDDYTQCSYRSIVFRFYLRGS